MSSQSFTTLGDVVNVYTVCATVIGSVTTTVYHNHTSAADTDLGRCKKDLDEVKERLAELSPDRRARLRRAAEQGRCPSLEKLEEELHGLLDERCELVERSEQATVWERYLPSRLSKLRKDIVEFDNAVQRLRLNTFATTTLPVKEDRNRSSDQARPWQLEHSGQPGDYPLGFMPPPAAHVVARRGGTEATEAPV